MARTNLITNASFRSATTGWSALSTASIALNTSTGFIGTSSLYVSNITSTSTGVELTNFVTIDESKDYSISGYLRINSEASAAVAGSITMRIVWANSSNTTVLTSTATLSVPKDSEWYRIGLTVPAATIPATAVKAKVAFIPTTSSTITEFYLDAVLFEQNSYIEEFYEDFNQVPSTIQSQIVSSNDSTVLSGSKQALENSIVNNALKKCLSHILAG